MSGMAAPFCQLEIRPDSYFTGIYILHPPNKSNLIWCAQAKPAGRQSNCVAQRPGDTGSVPRRPGQGENQYFNSSGLGNTHIKSCPLRTQTDILYLIRTDRVKHLTHLQKCTIILVLLGLVQIVSKILRMGLRLLRRMP